jgi:hypothetical protein
LSVGDFETENEAGRQVPRAIEEAECVNEVNLLDEATKYAGELRMGPGMLLGASLPFLSSTSLAWEKAILRQAHRESRLRTMFRFVLQAP